jgi:hypothetical protein
MSLIYIPLEEISKDHLDQLIDAKTAESKYIEYKRQTYGTKDEDRKEFLADISSFANSDGGDIIIGIEEANNVPIRYAPWNDCDKEIERLENIARTALEPRISELSTRKILISKNEYIVIIRIARSFYLPHRVTFGGSNRFFMRSSSGKYQPNVQELRELFNATPKFIKRAEELRLDRISEIIHQPPVTLSSKRLLIMHLIPNSTFNFYQYISLNEIIQKGISFIPIGRSYPPTHHLDIDNITYMPNVDPKAPLHCYTSVFTSGIVEAVRILDNKVHIESIANDIEKTTKLYIENLYRLGFAAPLLLVISMIGTDGMILDYTTHANYFPGDDTFRKINKSRLLFKEIMLNKLPQSNEEWKEFLLPFINQLANTVGLATYPIT